MNWWRQIHAFINGRNNPSLVPNTVSPVQDIPETETSTNTNSHNTTTAETTPSETQVAPAMNPQFVWMGYQYQFVEEIACGKAYKITGFQASSDRVNNNRPTSNILGFYVIFTEHTNVANYPKPEDLQKYL